MSRPRIALTADLMLRAYSVGLFPMAQSADTDELAWFDPDPRGILPLDSFHLPHRLSRTVRSARYRVTADRDFDATIANCAEATAERPNTWINGTIHRIFSELHEAGFAHSVEVWQEDALVGGLYGVALGGAFFGESMFSRARDASKVALVHLVARLKHCGFTLLDTQFVTEHLAQFGATQIPRGEYRRRLAQALRTPAEFHCAGMEDAVGSLVQSTTDKS